MSSEAPKLLFNNFDHEVNVSLDQSSSSVLIEKLQLDNPELFSILNKMETNQQMISEVKKIIDLGTFVKNKVQTLVDTDFVDLRIREMTAQFDQEMEETKSQILTLVSQNFDPSKVDSYANKINSFFKTQKDDFFLHFQNAMKEISDSKKSIASKIDESFDPNLKSSHLSKVIEVVDGFEKQIKSSFDFTKDGSISSQFKKMFDTNFGNNGNVIRLFDQKFSFDNPQSVLNTLVDKLMKPIEEVKREIEFLKKGSEIEAEFIEKSTAKGYDFEDKVSEMLEIFARNAGDLVEDVSTASGQVTRSKKGDFVYQVNSLKKRIAIEARDRNEQQTPSSLIKIMEKSKENRLADYVIYVTANESQLHKQIGLFQEYDDDKIVTHYGLLEIALKVAISRLKIENSSIEGIDRNAVEQEIQNITSALNGLKIMKTAANNILKEASKIVTQSEQIKEEINDSIKCLNEIMFENEISNN